MPRYEYKVVPAPKKGLKGKGVKGAEARFSYAVQELMNGLSGYGWEYQRAETLPSVERSGLTGSTTEWRNVLVFRRVREEDADAFTPELLPAPGMAAVAEETPEVQGGAEAEALEETVKHAEAEMEEITGGDINDDTSLADVSDDLTDGIPSEDEAKANA